jgi:hypothetical protein
VDVAGGPHLLRGEGGRDAGPDRRPPGGPAVCPAPGVAPSLAGPGLVLRPALPGRVQRSGLPGEARARRAGPGYLQDRAVPGRRLLSLSDSRRTMHEPTRRVEALLASTTATVRPT